MLAPAFSVLSITVQYSAASSMQLPVIVPVKVYLTVLREDGAEVTGGLT